MRQGIEDYRLLRVVQQWNAEADEALVNRCIRGFRDYSESVADFGAAYRARLEAAAKAQRTEPVSK